jgi:hypothetical protein
METAITQPVEAARSPKPHARGFWLTSLIVGASIVVWLTLIGSVAAGIVIANAAGDINNAFSNEPAIAHVSSSESSGSFTDADGYECQLPDTDAHNLCPENPRFGSEEGY